MDRHGKQPWLIAAILAAFVATGLWYFMMREGVDGDDLSSSYVGCRLLAAGQASHLYAHDPKNFAAIGPDDPWQHAADTGGYRAFLHPYVQTPLWGYSLLPLCRHTSWHQFEWVFAVLALLSFSALIALVARCWAPTLFTPVSIACTLALVWFSVPFQYSMWLMQTHVFFLLAMIAALLLTDRKRPVLAGLLLAIAATVKITPAILILYWLVRRQWKAAAAAAGWLAALWLLTRLIAGPQLMATYSATLVRVSHTLLLSRNNQSMAAWWMDHVTSAPSEPFEPLPLPNALRLASSALLALTAMAGGWLDRRRGSEGTPFVPLGGLFTMVGATLFAPLAWTHYSIVLIAPVMVLVQYARSLHARWITLAVIAILALNLPPLASDPLLQTLPRLALLRSHFYSEVLCLAALAALAFRNRSETS